MLLSLVAFVARSRMRVAILGGLLAGGAPAVGLSGGLIGAWNADNDQSGSTFGASVASAGDVNGDGYADFIVGAPTYDFVQVDEGRAYLYLGSASSLSRGAAWNAEINESRAFFGTSVASAGDVNGDGYSDVIVGAYGSFGNGLEQSGRAFVYLGSASGLSATAAWTASGSQAYAKFGTSVASAGDVNGDGFADVIVGAPGAGKAYVYLGSASGLGTAAARVLETSLTTSTFAQSVASAGDVNGDGFSEVLVSVGQGAFMYQGSAQGLGSNPAWTASENYSIGSVASAGDVNGDGYSDVVIAAKSYRTIPTVFLYLGSASGLASSAAWTAEGTVDGSQGYTAVGFQSVSSAGDVNGDGYSDLVVGRPGGIYYAPAIPDPFYSDGSFALYLGSASGLATAPSLEIYGEVYLGTSVASVGDMNGDGLSDVIIGVPGQRYVAVLHGANRSTTSATINLSGNGLVITPGDNTPDQADGTDFGTTSIVSGSVRRTFTITNTGGSPLTLTGTSRVRVVATTSTQSAFKVTSQPAALVLPGQNTNFEVRYDPTNTIDQSAVLSIVNNTTATVPFTFRVQGKGSLNCDERHTCFIERQYFDFLRRAPDSAGVSFYVDNICSGSSDVDDTVAQFLFADEFTNTVGFVCRAYFGIFNNNAVTTSGSPLYRIPDYEGLRYWSGRMNDILQFGGSLRTAQLNVVAGFAGSQEWRDRVGNRANPEFVDFLYENLLGRFADSAGKAYWVQRLNDGLDRNGVIRDFLTSSEAASIYAIRVNAGMAYLGLFDRSAEKAGFDYHVDFQTRFGTQAFLRNLIRSNEYRNRLVRVGCFFPEDLP